MILAQYMFFVTVALVPGKVVVIVDYRFTKYTPTNEFCLVYCK